MRSTRKATIIFVAILLLFLLSFVSAELIKRDPQAPGGGGGGGGGGGDQPPAGGAGGGGGGGKQPPAGGGGGQPAAGDGGGNQPPAGGGGGQPAAGGGGQPAAGDGGGVSKSPGGNPPGPKSPGGNPPGPQPSGGNPPGPQPSGGNNPTNGTAPKYVPPDTPTVQVQMIEPKSAKNIIYKIGTNITFKWNYSTDFLDPPKVVMVQAQSQVDTKTYYPIQNLTLSATQEAFWDTAAVPSLAMSEYKLWISDQDGIKAPPKPGGLQIYSGLSFGLYTSQDTGTFCETCSNAISLPMISLTSTIGLALMTIASFNLI